jgi:hypothetical protein
MGQRQLEAPAPAATAGAPAISEALAPEPRSAYRVRTKHWMYAIPDEVAM